MKPRLVRFTETAQSHVEREKRWWLENRAHTEIFADELDVAVKLLALLPGAGTQYAKASVAGLRRLYLRKSASHVYYTFDDREVVVRALWGARGREGPPLTP